MEADDKPAIARALTLGEELRAALPAGANEAEDRLVALFPVFRALLLDEIDDRAKGLETSAQILRQLQDSLNRPPSQPQKGGKGKAKKNAKAAPQAEKNDEAAPADGTAFVLPDWVDEMIFREFLAGVPIALEEMEALILELEHGDTDRMPELRRRIHTLKGESGVVGLDDLEHLSHAIEDYIDRGEIAQGFVDSLLQFKDWVSQAVAAYGQGLLPKEPVAPLLAAFKGKAKTEAPKAVLAEAEKNPNVLARDPETLAMIGDFLNESDEGLAVADETLMTIECEGGTPERINSLFRVFHTIKGIAGFLELTGISNLAHDTETLLNQARQETIVLKGPLLDIVFDSTAMMRGLLGGIRLAVESGDALSPPDGYEALRARLHQAIAGELPPEETPVTPLPANKRLGEALVETGLASPADVDEALQRQKESGKRIGEELVASGAVSPKEVAQTLRAQAAGQPGAKIKETVKIDIERVDSLVEMIGELAIVETMVVSVVNRLMGKLGPDQAATILFAKNQLGQLSKISRDLQRVGMSMRMVPVRGVFQKMSRMVRDLSKKAGKNVELITNGEAAEMDRSMVEQIGDPLVHMIRNSVDHGIEGPEERLACGKSEKGTITLSAYHEGGSIVIEIEDDGRGLDRETILAKARAKGMLRPNETPSDSDIYSLIFAPGFSTAKQVTEISGRGVGMDVVRRNIEAMHGRIAIQTEKGKGTTFKLILPLTLAIIDGMLVACGAEQYILPTLSIIESIKPEQSMLASFGGRGELLNLRGQMIPLLRLHQVLNISQAKHDPTQALVVVLESVDKRIGLLVDEVVTQQQVVIKSLDSGMDSTSLISGAAILSNGHVGLILNIEEIAKMTGNAAYGKIGVA